jgi:ATP-dependent Lon protease
MCTAMLSAFTQRAVNGRVAMTGEITLRGHVLPVGGIKEKVLAARRSGIHTVVLPHANRKNIEDVPKSLRRDMKFVFVRHVREVFDQALAPVAVAPPPTLEVRARELVLPEPVPVLQAT